MMSPFSPLGTKLHHEAGLGAAVVGKIPSTQWGAAWEPVRTLSHVDSLAPECSLRRAGPPRLVGWSHVVWDLVTWSLCPGLSAFPQGRSQWRCLGRELLSRRIASVSCSFSFCGNNRENVSLEMSLPFKDAISLRCMARVIFIAPNRSRLRFLRAFRVGDKPRHPLWWWFVSNCLTFIKVWLSLEAELPVARWSVFTTTSCVVVNSGAAACTRSWGHAWTRMINCGSPAPGVHSAPA